MELTNNKKKDKVILGDKKTLGTKNVKFLWSSQKYHNENVYHLITMISLLLFIIFFIITFILLSLQKQDDVTPPPATGLNALFQTPALTCAFFCTIFLLTCILCRFKEWRISKQRKKDFVLSSSREIKISKD